MKQKLSVLLLAFCIASTTVAQTKPAPPTPAAPSKGDDSNRWDTALCEAHFDAQGNAKSVAMTKSTGSKVLDDRLVKAISLQFSKAPPNETLSMWMLCKTVEVTAKNREKSVRVAGPRPPYPLKARVQHLQGSGSVQISFDKLGNAVSATMASSTGSNILDENTIKFMLRLWKSSGGEAVITTVPVTYQLG